MSSEQEEQRRADGDNSGTPVDGHREGDGAQVGTGTSTGTAAESEEAVIPELVIISGMSGAGRSTAAKCLEDLGWFVVDNLPPALLPTMADLGLRSHGTVDRIAAVVDVRGRAFFADLQEALR
ncbi:MAG TPA: RNase adapter RapZ, partial [Streptomyces sp.]|nr:RNase adapter RapZ [Streptomyces sp.]